MGKIIVCTGGVRSGKSSYAIARAREFKQKNAFIATATPLDDEMKTRIHAHKESRGDSFITVEEPYDLAGAINRIDENVSIVVIDCLTVWLGNLFFKYDNDETIIVRQIDSLVQCLTNTNKCFIMVTNEIGWGIVPENKMARQFRDISGYMNQSVAKIASEVLLFVCGIPLKIK